MTDDDSFEAFVRRFQDMVFATAIRLLGNPTDAEDIAQAVFLRAYEHYGDIGESPRAPGWLKRVTTNLCLNHLSRHRARWHLFSEMDADNETEKGSYEDGLVARTPSPDANLADEYETLEKALHALPAHQRVPLVLFHFEGFSYQEVAERLGISLGKVKTDIHRGRVALKHDLEDDYGNI